MKAIIACDPKGGIGYKGGLPWDKLQGDLPRFKSLTEGQVVVMGRNTWDSLPKKPLSNRLNIIVSNKHHLELPNGAIRTSNINHFRHYHNAWLIGGSRLFESCWDMIDTIHLSQTYNEYCCDTYIDLYKIGREFEQTIITEYIDHTYEIWKRK
jgi:dihydrofolate reductase